MYKGEMKKFLTWASGIALGIAIYYFVTDFIF